MQPLILIGWQANGGRDPGLCHRCQGPFITGEAFKDANGNGAYDPGERLGGLSVTATSNDGQSFTTTTLQSGGFSLAVPSNETYDVCFSGAGMPSAMIENNILVASADVLADLKIA